MWSAVWPAATVGRALSGIGGNAIWRSSMMRTPQALRRRRRWRRCGTGRAGRSRPPHTRPAAHDGGVNGVSCVSSGACTAVGAYTDRTGTEVTMAEPWNERALRDPGHPQPDLSTTSRTAWSSATPEIRSSPAADNASARSEPTFVEGSSAETPGRRSSASTASPPATRRSIINVKAMRQIAP
jgi:hypothetical protein